VHPSIDDGQLHVACICRVFIYTYNSHIYILTHILYIYCIYSTIFTQFHTHIAYKIQSTLLPTTCSLPGLPGLPAISCNCGSITEQSHPNITYTLVNTAGQTRVELRDFPASRSHPGSGECLGSFQPMSGSIWWARRLQPSSSSELDTYPCGSWIFSDLWDEGSMRYIIMTWCRDSTFKQQFMDAESLQNLPSWDISKKT